MLRRFSVAAAFVGLALAAMAMPSLAHADLAPPPDLLDVAAHAQVECLATADAVAVETLFARSADPALCEPDLMAAAGLCLEPVDFSPDGGLGVILGLRALGCPDHGPRSPPG